MKLTDAYWAPIGCAVLIFSTESGNPVTFKIYPGYEIDALKDIMIALGDDEQTRERVS